MWLQSFGVKGKFYSNIGMDGKRKALSTRKEALSNQPSAQPASG
jgi:hypothetical protein